jgi:hypothetical protein
VARAYHATSIRELKKVLVLLIDIYCSELALCKTHPKNILLASQGVYLRAMQNDQRRLRWRRRKRAQPA